MEIEVPKMPDKMEMGGFFVAARGNLCGQNEGQIAAGPFFVDRGKLIVAG